MDKKLKVTVIIFAIIIIALLGVLAFYKPVQGPTVPANQIVLSPDGAIGITAPQINAIIVSPVGIQGQAVGTWFFEASFPVKVLDGNGMVLGQGPAQAIGEWMTTGTVPFAATIAFTAPKYATGTIVFSKDNPSGLPKNDRSFSFPVRFK